MLQWLLLLLLLAAALSGARAQRCEALRNRSACDGVLEYSSAVYLANGACQDGVETAGATPLQGSLPLLSSACRDAAALYGCAKTYPQCVSTPNGSGGTTVTAVRPCRSLCQAAALACTGETLPLMNVGLSLPAECAALPLTDCYAGPSPSNPSGFVQRTAYARCEPLATGSICDGVVDYSVYVPAHYTQSFFESNLQQSLPVLYVAPRGRCVTALLKYLCARAYLRCDTGVVKRAVGFDLPTPFPRLPCQRVCTTFASDCAAFLASNPRLSALVPACNSTGQYQPAKYNCGALTVAGGADFPLVDTTWATTPGPIVATLKSPCNSWALNDTLAAAVALAGNTGSGGGSGSGGGNGTASAEADADADATVVEDRAVTITIRCPYPLVVPDDPNAPNPIGGSCALPCPLPLLTRAEYYAFDRFFLVAAWVSVLLGGFLVVTWLAVPARRKNTWTLCFLVCVWFTTLPFMADLMPTSNPGTAQPPHNTLIFDRNTCKSNSEELDHTHARFPYCVAAAGIRHFFLTAIYGWWLVQAFDLFVRVAFPFYRLPHWIGRVYHGCVWGVASVVVVVGAVTKSYGPTQLMPICYVSDQDIDWFLTYLPLGTALVFGTALVVGILVCLIRSGQRVASSSTSPGLHVRGTKRDAAAQRALLQVLLVFDFVFLFPLVYRLIVYQQQDDITASTQQWVQCLLQTPGGTSVCGAHPSVRPNFGMFCIVLFLSAGSGIVAFAVYGLRKDLWYDWYLLCTDRCGNGASRGGGGGGGATDGSNNCCRCCRAMFGTSSDGSGMASGDHAKGGEGLPLTTMPRQPGSPHSAHHTKVLSADAARRYDVGPAGAQSNHTPAPPSAYAHDARSNPSSPMHSRRPLSPEGYSRQLGGGSGGGAAGGGVSGGVGGGVHAPRLVSATGTYTPAAAHRYIVAAPASGPAPARVGGFVSPPLVPATASSDAVAGLAPLTASPPQPTRSAGGGGGGGNSGGGAAASATASGNVAAATVGTPATAGSSAAASGSSLPEQSAPVTASSSSPPRANGPGLGLGPGAAPTFAMVRQASAAALAALRANNAVSPTGNARRF